MAERTATERNRLVVRNTRCAGGVAAPLKAWKVLNCIAHLVIERMVREPDAWISMSLKRLSRLMRLLVIVVDSAHIRIEMHHWTGVTAHVLGHGSGGQIIRLGA